MTIAVYQHTVPVWYVEVAEFAGHHHDSSEPKQCWKPVPEEREPLLAEAEVLFMQRWFIENGLQMVWQQWCTEEGLEGRKRRKSWKLRMEMRGSSVTASTIQAMSSSCFALHHCNPFFAWACFLSRHQMCDVQQGLVKNGFRSRGLGTVIFTHVGCSSSLGEQWSFGAAVILMVVQHHWAPVQGSKLSSCSVFPSISKYLAVYEGLNSITWMDW